MNNALDIQQFDVQALKRYAWSITIVMLVGLGVLIGREKYTWIAIMAAAPIGLFLITQPKLAVFQYTFALFLNLILEDNIPVLLIDLSAGVVIMAAFLDLTGDRELPRRFPPLTGSFMLLFGVLFVSGLAGYDPMLSMRTLARIVVLYVTFLALTRLAGRIGVGFLLRLYFWLAVAHAVVAIGQFVASGGELRSFGLSPKLLDDLSMIALPIGVAFFLWSKRGVASFYLLGCGLVFGALIATQSRMPIVIASGLCALVMLLSWLRLRRATSDSGTMATTSPVGRRMALLLGGLAAACVGAVLAFPDLFETVLWRFERLFSSTPRDTVLARLALWKWAFRAFGDNPILGVGPGTFRSIMQIYPEASLDAIYYYVRGFSAHNILIHYLAESGLLGASALVLLFVNQFRLARKSWRRAPSDADPVVPLLMLVLASLFLLTTFVEAGWLWGSTGHIFVYFAAQIAVLSRAGR